MQRTHIGIIILAALILSTLAAGCTPGGPCQYTSNVELTLYRVPDPGAEIWGVEPAGQTHEIQVRTADGWVGIDPGVAQADSVGLARHRYFKLNVLLDPTCLVNVPLVTLADVLADFPITPPPPAPSPGAANLVITELKLPDTLLAVNTFGDVEVTVENQGDAPAAGYEVWLFPQIGSGPPNPAGHDAIPELAPGASQTIFLPDGIIYTSPGTFTMRALVTDDWLTLGDPSSTGTAGDLRDAEIRIVPGLCSPFADRVISFVSLNLPADTRILPFYLKVEGGIEFDPSTLEASLGELKAYQCGLQGFEDRIYCLVHVPEGQEGQAKQLVVRVKDCPEPAFVLDNVLIPIPKLACTADLDKAVCEEAGGTYQESRTASGGECICP